MPSYRRSQEYGSETAFHAFSDKTVIRRNKHYGTKDAVHPMATVEYSHPYEHPRVEEGTVLQPQGSMLQYHPGAVRGAFSDPSMRQHVPTLLGLVGDLSHRLTGGKELPMPSSNLSEHSSRMIKHLRSKGVDLPENPMNPESDARNGLGFEPRYTSYPEDYGDPVSHEDVQAGRKMIRSILRPPKSEEAHAMASPQFRQQTLL